MAATRTYDPGKIFMTLAAIPISGFADGSFVSIKRATEAFSKTVGAGGEVARVRSRDRSGVIKFTLLGSSPCNDLLSALAAADETNGSGIGVFGMSDAQGTTLASASNAWIKMLPEVELGKELTNREWEIECESLDLFVGSNV